MCTISGIISIEKKKRSLISKSDIRYFEKILRKGESRWKDWIWIYSSSTWLIEFTPFRSKDSNHFSYNLFKKLGCKSWNSRSYLRDKGTFSNLFTLLWHNRAIPESEEQTKKTQPLESEHFILVHNGIISNDKEILWNKHWKIDSYSILQLLENWLKMSKSTISLEILFSTFVVNDIKWSYWLCLYRKDTRESLIWTNFQPLSYKFSEWKLFFSSKKEYLEKSDIVEDSKIQDLNSYSYIHIRQMTWKIQVWKFSKEEIKENRWLVLASWGLDTCVVAWIMKKKYNCKDLIFLHFDYWHKVEDQEQEALENMIKKYWAKYVSIKLDFLKELFKDSPLLTWKIDTSWKWLELNLEYVPVRNLLFLSLATSYAEVQGYNLIWFGWNLSESMSYSDTTSIFIERLNKLLPNAIWTDKNIEIIDPLKDLLKHEIIAEGIKVWAPMNLSWSCYQDWDKHCWECASCRLRKIWMKRNWLDILWNNLS